MGTLGNPSVGAVGVRLKITVKEDSDTGSFPVVNLGDFDTYQMILQAPDKTESTVTATLFTDGTDGVMYYDTLSTTLTARGTWRRKPVVLASGTGNTFTGSWISFEVDP